METYSRWIGFEPAPDYDRYQFLKVAKKDKVAVVTLNRPEALNSFVVGMHGEVEDVLNHIRTDEEVNVLVLTGAGRAFSAGADIRGQAGKSSQLTPSDRVAHCRVGPPCNLINMLAGLRQPTIAAVNGPAIGLGATLALFCDIVIASEKAKFGDTHIKIGLVPGDGGCVIWPMLVGLAKAKELLWTGDIIDAATAERIGLVSYVVPPDNLMPKAMELATRLAKGPSAAIEFAKRSVNKRLRDEVNLVMDLSDAVEHLTYFTEDHKEGPRAFIEKREPHFTGR